MNKYNILHFALHNHKPIGHIPYDERMRIIRARYRAWAFNVRTSNLALV